MRWTGQFVIKSGHVAQVNVTKANGAIMAAPKGEPPVGRDPPLLRLASSSSSAAPVTKRRTISLSVVLICSGVPSKMMLALVQHDDAVGHLEGAVHVVRDDDAGDLQLALELEDQLVDDVRPDGIEARWSARRRG